MKKFTIVVLLIIVQLFFFGCATPEVKYHAKDDISKNYIPFALLASRITIALPDIAKDGDTIEKKIAAFGVGNFKSISTNDLKNTKVFVTPTQAKGTLHYLEPHDGIFSKTNLSITYFDAMKAPKNVGVVVEDNTIKLVSAFGAVGGALGTIFAASAQQQISTKEQKIALPIVLDFSNIEDFSTYGKEQCKPMEDQNTGYGYCYTFTEKEGRKTTNDKNQVVNYREFFDAYENEFTRHVPFSRCVDVMVLIKQWDRKKNVAYGDALATYNTVIADPYHVDWLPLPQKGSITSQGICDANSTTEKSDNPNAFDIIEAMGKQVDSIWKAWHPPSK